MRIDKVEAHAFGPFRDKELSLAPRMTVVFGPNESGKSTWHAAIYGGLCGLRHVGGRPLKEDEVYEQRHRPWDGNPDEWRASVYVTLANGRHLHFHCDLDGRNDYVQDATTGRDVVSELRLENEGAPDGAKLLGLTRRTILATIQVRQADVLHVLEAPDGLQEHLQQAAASGGDVTAERAIEHLDEFHSQEVGTMAWNSKRPLKAAHDRVEEAEAELERVRQTHEDYVDLQTELHAAREESARLHRQLEAAEAMIARRQFNELEGRYERARNLAASLPDDRPDVAGEDERIGAVTDALAAWDNRPEEPKEPSGPSVAELERRIADLPAPPEGETRPAPAVEQVADDLEDARRRLSYHRDSEPAEVGPVEEVGEPEAEPVPSWPPTRIALVAGGALAAVVGAVLLATGTVAVGAVLLVAGATAAAIGALRSSSGSTDPAVVERRVAERERRTWQRRRDRLEEEVRTNEQALRTALANQGVDGADDTDRDVDQLLTDYREACRRRQGQAEQAGRRDELESKLEARQEAEGAVRRVRTRRAEAEERLREVGERVGISAQDPDELAEELRRCRMAAREAQEEKAGQRERWAELETLLDGHSLDELAAEVERQRKGLPRIPEGVDHEEAAELADRRAELQEAATSARDRVNHLEGNIEDKEGSLDSVVEAEEELERARAELERAQELDETVELTRGFLDEARQRVQQEFAPLLQQAVEAELPDITLGRYQHVRVDPDSLEVRVSPDGSKWRDAKYLSQGTAEQIYLLLRLAMAEHAVATEEPAPLILDDVTVQSDPTRTRRFLELLHRLSQERQVIFFTQEPDAFEWARQHLGNEDRIVELEPQEIPA